MPFSDSRARLLFAGAALALFAVATAGCSSDTSDVAAGNAVTTTVAPASTVLPTTPPSTIVPTVDPAPLLKEAVAALQPGYHFSSTFVVNGAVTLTADGDRVGDSSRLDATQNGATVSYVVTPTASYAKPANGEWQLLDTPPATTDPITALNAPGAIGVVTEDGSSMRLRVTVSALTLGVAPDGDAQVEVVLVKGAVAEVDYSTTKDGNVASVATVISPLTDATPIVAPI